MTIDHDRIYRYDPEHNYRAGVAFYIHLRKDRNVSELSSLQVYFGKPTCNCYKLALLTDFSYFIATYGGVFSLSFGGSILTVCEILYLLFSSLAKVLWRNIRKYAAKNRNKPQGDK